MSKYTSDDVRAAHAAQVLDNLAWAEGSTPADVLAGEGAAPAEYEQYQRGKGILVDARLTYSERHAPGPDGDDSAEVWSGYRATSPTTRTARLIDR